MKKIKIKLFGIVAIILLVSLILFMNFPKNYIRTYYVNDYKIEEEYIKKYKVYRFKVKYQSKNYETVALSKYLHKTKLIEAIDILDNSEKNEACILLKSSKLILTPTCRKGDEVVDISLLETDTKDFYKRDKIKENNRETNNIKIKNFVGNTLIWAKRGFYFITKEKSTEIMFLKNDSYYNSLGFKVGKYVITPNYDEEYVFQKFYIINLENGKLSEWTLDDIEISFNSYFLGEHNNLAYLFDRKEKKEYALDFKRKKIELVSKDGIGLVWNKGWEKVSTVKLANNDYKFNYDKAYTYEIKDAGLYQKVLGEEIKLLNKKIDKIVYENDDEIYYLIGPKLYDFKPNYGINEVMSYSEWEFNNLNSIFIY